MAFDDIELHLVEGLGDVEDMMRWLGERREFLALDVETTGLNVGHDRIRLAQFGDGRHGWAMDYRDWRGVCKEVIERYDRRIVIHNALFDSKFLKADGITVPQRLAHDSMIMAWLADPGGYFDLKGAAARWVDKRARSGQGALKAAMAQGGWDWETVPVRVPAYWAYSAMDTCLSALLAEELYPRTGGGPLRRAYELEMAVVSCLREAELAGLLVDDEYRRAAAERLEAEVARLRPQIPCEPGSDKQVTEYLLSAGVPLSIRTEKGQLSVDKTVLTYFEPTFPVCGVIRDWRAKRRLLDAYLYKFGPVEEGGLAAGGVLRASTKPVGARTGRMSVTDPPLQTLPRGRVVRDAVVARPGHVLVLADFHNMEMRALASLAQESSMIDAFARGEDLHEFVARSIFGEGYTKQQRTLAKNASFAKVYGAGLLKFSMTAGVDQATAASFLETYEGMFPGVQTFMDRTTTDVLERAGGRRGRGWVELFDGRRLPVDADRAFTGVNYKIQGGCAATTKEKIVELDAAGLGPYFRLAVHDELVYEVPAQLAARALEVVREVMPDRRNWPGVVLEVETDVCDRWGAHYRDDYEAYVETDEPPWVRDLRETA